MVYHLAKYKNILPLNGLLLFVFMLCESESEEDEEGEGEGEEEEREHLCLRYFLRVSL